MGPNKGTVVRASEDLERHWMGLGLPSCHGRMSTNFRIPRRTSRQRRFTARRPQECGGSVRFRPNCQLPTLLTCGFLPHHVSGGFSLPCRFYTQIRMQSRGQGRPSDTKFGSATDSRNLQLGALSAGGSATHSRRDLNGVKFSSTNLLNIRQGPGSAVMIPSTVAGDHSCSTCLSPAVSLPTAPPGFCGLPDPVGVRVGLSRRLHIRHGNEACDPARSTTDPPGASATSVRPALRVRDWLRGADTASLTRSAVQRHGLRGPWPSRRCWSLDQSWAITLGSNPVQTSPSLGCNCVTRHKWVDGRSPSGLTYRSSRSHSTRLDKNHRSRQEEDL
jgi:hypothetical protein